nr:conserved hypothetical protein [Albugo laibachii Nc14]|eukprot:CCA16317.1 conserved hypothetical protein [Albugo laibachii Nc14]
MYQSAVISAFAILSIALNPLNGDASVGFADGSVRIFTYDGVYAKERMSKDIARIIRKEQGSKRQNQEEQEQNAKVKMISSLPTWAKRDNGQQNSLDDRFIEADYDIAKLHREESLIPIVKMTYVVLEADQTQQRAEHKLNFNGHKEKRLVPEQHLLLIATSQYLMSMNVLSSKVTILMDFQNQQFPCDASSHISISTIKDICWHISTHPLSVICGALSAFEPKVTIFPMQPWGQLDKVKTENQHDQILDDPIMHGKSGNISMSSDNWSSIIPQVPPSVESILNLPPLPAFSPGKLSTGMDRNKSISRSLRIRSSGYGAEMPFQLALAKKKKAQVRKKRVSTSQLEIMSKEYPVDCEAIRHFQQKHALHDITLHNGAIHTMEFSSGAKYLATGGGDHVGQICKLPMNKYQGEGNVFLGHNDAVRLVRWSHNNKTLLTTSNDQSACLWAISSDMPSLTWNSAFVPVESSGPSTTYGINRLQAASKLQKDRTKRRQDITAAQFFYMDKFVLIAAGNFIRLYQYTLDTRFADSKRENPRRKKNAPQAISEMKNRSRKRKVGNWQFPDFHNVKAIACVNGSLLSHSIVLSGSDRSIRVFDVATEQIARMILDAHERGIHTLALPHASCYTSHPSNYYDLLLSSSFTSTIHLWDLRTAYCVMQFNQHKNRIHSVGMAFSPCMRYMTTGSEDRKAVMYDVRTGRALHYLSGHTDVVTSVAYNPLHPQLATASYDGTVRFYSDH